MLYAKLKTPKTFSYDVSPVETLSVNATHIRLAPIDYVLGTATVRLFIDFCILKEVPKDQSSTPIEDQEVTFLPESVKRFDLDLTNEEVSNWNENDESLLQIVADKYNLEIEGFFTY